MISTQFDAHVKILRTDNSTEYMIRVFQEYLKAHKILHQTCCVNTSSQNWVSEREIRHLLEVARSLIFTMNVPKPYWGNAILSATYLINRMPFRTLELKSPLEVLQGKNSYTIPPKVFCYVCFVINLIVGN